MPRCAQQWRPGPVRVPHVHEVYYTHTVPRPSAFSLPRLFVMTKGLTRYRAAAKKLTTRRYHDTYVLRWLEVRPEFPRG